MRLHLGELSIGRKDDSNIAHIHLNYLGVTITIY